jgi:proline iminopeptidase
MVIPAWCRESRRTERQRTSSTRQAIAALAIACMCLALPARAWATAESPASPGDAAHESQLRVRGCELYLREIGRGRSIIILHGGPDFDHRYLLPDLDRLSDSYHLIYYDQRGRGQSAAGVHAQEVSLASDIADLDSIREHFHLQSVVLLGHSWGTVLALEYALRHPQRVSDLILMNPAPASAADLAQFRAAYAQKLGPDFERQRQIIASAPYRAGDPEAVTQRYRLHFKPALMRSGDYERLMVRMQAAFMSQGAEGILTARAVEDNLMRETWQRADYDLLPRVAGLEIRTLVISGDHGFFPAAVAEHIARATPTGELVVLKDCGHFAFLECPSGVHTHIDAFLRRRQER